LGLHTTGGKKSKEQWGISGNCPGWGGGAKDKKEKNVRSKRIGEVGEQRREERLEAVEGREKTVTQRDARKKKSVEAKNENESEKKLGAN